jgi:hypothetical protein
MLPQLLPPAAQQPPAPTSTVSAPPPAPAPVAKQDPPAEPQASAGGFGYKVLPKSYWSGASWRWRMKRDDDAAPPASSQ